MDGEREIGYEMEPKLHLNNYNIWQAAQVRLNEARATGYHIEKYIPIPAL